MLSLTNSFNPRKAGLLLILLAAMTAAPRVASASPSSPFAWGKTETGDGKVTVTVDVSPKHHLTASSTSVRLTGGGRSFEADTKPAAAKALDAQGKPEPVFPAGRHSWVFSRPSLSSPAIEIKYQGCGEEPFVCYPPEELSLTLDTAVGFAPAAAANAVQARNRHDATGGWDAFGQRLSGKSGAWLLLAALLGGLATAFTPCVLPLIPVTLAVMGAKGAGVTFPQSLRRALLYVAGMTISFTLLGMSATLAGKSLGFLLGSVWFQSAVAVFFALMAVSLLGLYDISLPSSLQSKVNSVGGAGDKGAFLMGLFGGFVAVPCVGPVLAALLGLAATLGNIFFSTILLGLYAIGFGIPLLVIGLGFAKLPKSGGLMESAKSALGVSVMILAIYIAAIAFPALGALLSKPSETSKAAAVVLIIAGALLGAFHLDGHDPRRKVRMTKLAAAVMLAFGTVWTLKIPVAHEASTALTWSHDIERSLADAKKSGKPICLDFSAEWCAACKELETRTFSEPRVVEKLKNGWTLTRIDGTRSSKALRAIESRYGVKGYPTIILLAPDGKEARRSTGFIGPDAFLTLLDVTK